MDCTYLHILQAYFGYENSQHFHEFICAAKSCKNKDCCYLDKKDAKLCWGPDAVKAADRAKNVTEAHDSVIQPLSKDGSIMVILERVGKGKVLYSH